MEFIDRNIPGGVLYNQGKFTLKSIMKNDKKEDFLQG